MDEGSSLLCPILTHEVRHFGKDLSGSVQEITGNAWCHDGHDLQYPGRNL